MTADAKRLEHEAHLSREVLISWWRDWITYLETRLAMLDLPPDMQSGAEFDHDRESPTAATAQRLRETMARIPPERKTVFDGITAAATSTYRREYEEARRTTPDAVQNLESATLSLTELDRQSLIEELDAARGDEATGRMAVVPTSLESSGWYELPPSILAQVPPSVAYRANRNGRFGGIRRDMIFPILMLIGSIGGLIWWFMPKSTQATVVGSDAEQIRVGDTPTTAWPLAGMRIDDGDTLPITVIDAAAWPPTTLSDGVAVREPSMAPRIICFAGDTPLPTTLDLLGKGTIPNLTIRVTDTVDPAASVRIERCADGTPIGSGTVDLILPPVAALGEAHTVGQLPLVRLDQIRVRDANTGSLVAQGMIEVTITAFSDAPMDWYGVFPSLRFPDDQSRSHTRIVTTDGGTDAQIIYEFSAVGQSVPIRWQITDPATGITGMWQSDLPLPPTREAWLTDHLTWDVMDATWQTTDAMPDLATLSVTLVITPTGDVPITIQTTDVAVFQSDQGIGPVAFATDQTAISLTPPTISPLTVTLLADPRNSVQVYLGLTGFVVPAYHEGGQ